MFSRSAGWHLLFEFGISIPSAIKETMFDLNSFNFAPFDQVLGSIPDLASLNL